MSLRGKTKKGKKKGVGVGAWGLGAFERSRGEKGLCERCR